MPVWSVSKQQLPQITQELARDRIADVIANAARAMASAPDEFFERRHVDRPVDGSCFLVRRSNPAESADLELDGWEWPNEENVIVHQLSDSLKLTERTRTTSTTNSVVLTRKRFVLSAVPDLMFVQYLKIKESISKVQTAKETVKNEPAVTGKKPRSAKKSTELKCIAQGFEDHSVPVLVSLARYKRNHEFINELFSATPYEKQEEALHTKATMDEIHALEAEIKELEEQNKKLLSNTAVAMELQIAHNFRPKKKKTVHRDPYINMLETQSLLPIHDRSCTSKRQLSRLETACHILSDKTILLIVWFGLVVLIGLNCVIAATCFYSANPDARCILYAGVGASIAVAAIYLLALGIYVALALCSSNSGHIVSETHVY
ncbi:hypothetical protein HDU83_000145 [Entophlyctis luteolus]|nr:hypothetical protein HDU83_000145 [Entophlyctis luteolus]